VSVVGLVVGAWAIALTNQAYKWGGQPFLPHLVKYLIFSNILAVLIVIDLYTCTNLLGGNKLAFPKWYTVFKFLVRYLSSAFLLLSAVRMAQALRERPVPAPTNGALWTFIGLFGIAHVISATILLREGSGLWLYGTESALVIVVGIIGIGVLFYLAVGKHSQLNTERKTAVRQLTAPLVAVYLFLILAFVLLSSTDSITWSPYLVVAIFLLWQNCVPLVWLKTVFAKCYSVTTPLWSVKAVDTLVEQHQITKREREVMDLIIEGRSNKEIESTLFISFHTVKNHIYNLYNKLGVNSRGQLIRILSERGGPR
jgi:DNA-binding CsgD family transcriptional regulator